MSDLKRYEQALDEALRSKKPFTTYNRDITHAAIITRVAFCHAGNKVRLLSHRLDPVLYGTGPLQRSIADFLCREGTSLHILVETDLPGEHPILKLLTDDSRETMKIKKVPPDLAERYPFNYLVVDEIGYRFESDRQEYAAIASFHDNEVDGEGDRMTDIDGLIDFFDRLEEKSVDIPQAGIALA